MKSIFRSEQNKPLLKKQKQKWNKNQSSNANMKLQLSVRQSTKLKDQQKMYQISKKQNLWIQTRPQSYKKNQNKQNRYSSGKLLRKQSNPYRQSAIYNQTPNIKQLICSLKSNIEYLKQKLVGQCEVLDKVKRTPKYMRYRQIQIQKMIMEQQMYQMKLRLRQIDLQQRKHKQIQLMEKKIEQRDEVMRQMKQEMEGQIYDMTNYLKKLKQDNQKRRNKLNQLQDKQLISSPSKGKKIRISFMKSSSFRPPQANKIIYQPVQSIQNNQKQTNEILPTQQTNIQTKQIEQFIKFQNETQQKVEQEIEHEIQNEIEDLLDKMNQTNNNILKKEQPNIFQNQNISQFIQKEEEYEQQNIKDQNRSISSIKDQDVQFIPHNNESIETITQKFERMWLVKREQLLQQNRNLKLKNASPRSSSSSANNQLYSKLARSNADEIFEYIASNVQSQTQLPSPLFSQPRSSVNKTAKQLKVSNKQINNIDVPIKQNKSKSNLSFSREQQAKKQEQQLDFDVFKYMDSHYSKCSNLIIEDDLITDKLSNLQLNSIIDTPQQSKQIQQIQQIRPAKPKKTIRFQNPAIPEQQHEQSYKQLFNLQQSIKQFDNKVEHDNDEIDSEYLKKKASEHLNSIYQTSLSTMKPNKRTSKAHVLIMLK